MRSVTEAYEFQIISGIFANVLYDVTVGYPFGNHREPPIIEGIRNADKIEDIGMGQVLPHGDFLAEVLRCVSARRRDEKI